MMHTSTQSTTNASVELPANARSSALGVGGEAETEGPVLACLTCVAGAAENTALELRAGSYVLGRGGSSGVRIRDERMSREHCLLIVGAKGSVTMIDLHSSNGSVVNGRRVRKARLEDGDMLRLGSSSFKFIAQDVADLLQ